MSLKEKMKQVTQELESFAEDAFVKNKRMKIAEVDRQLQEVKDEMNTTRIDYIRYSFLKDKEQTLIRRKLLFQYHIDDYLYDSGSEET